MHDHFLPSAFPLKILGIDFAGLSFHLAHASLPYFLWTICYVMDWKADRLFWKGRFLYETILISKENANHTEICANSWRTGGHQWNKIFSFFLCWKIWVKLLFIKCPCRFHSTACNPMRLRKLYFHTDFS